MGVNLSKLKYNRSDYKLLSIINFPNDLKKLSIAELILLAEEIRNFLIATLDVSGGHFASSLGVLELSLALHYVYYAPYDNIIWDVGHQTYVHNILTGRADQLINIKKYGGLSGFPKRSESNYDAFGVGHSSTSISAALGMTEASKLSHIFNKTVAVIGDGALTGGMAFEALNHAGGIHSDLLVILNDNEMSISKNVGGLTKHLTRIFAGSAYNQFRKTSKHILKNLPQAFEIVKKLETQAKGIFFPANLFEALGFYYVGSINGHDIKELINIIKILREYKGPKFLHVLTKKGNGYKKAEIDPIKFHHVSPKFHSNNKAQTLKKTTYSNILVVGYAIWQKKMNV